MPSYLLYKQTLDNNFVESEHPRNNDGRFIQKENPAPVSPEHHQKETVKIKSVQNYLKEQGIKTKGAKATRYGSLYIKAYLPTKKGFEWADITFRDHPSDEKFDLILPTEATLEDFIKEFENTKNVFAESNKKIEAQRILRKDQYKNN